MAVYAPFLDNGWVWDDHALLEANPALSSFSGVFCHDIFGLVRTTHSDIYRPLAMATHAVTQAVARGPFIDHVVNLLLHLLAVVLVARLARALGGSVGASWLGAAWFGVHTGASEPVFWATGRHDLVGAVLLLGGWVAMFERRTWTAGLLLGLAPFAKEPFILTPITVLIWGVATRRLDVRALSGSALGVAAYFGIRALLALPMPTDAAQQVPFGPIGASAVRLLTLTFIPASASATPPYVAAPLFGVGATVVGVGLALGVRRVPALAALLAPLVLWLPTTLFAERSGLVSDRYAYLLLAGTGILAGARLPGAGRVFGLLWLLPLALAAVTLARGGDWRDDESLFAQDLRVDATDARAALELGLHYQQRERDCARAIPLFQIAMDAEPRAATHLQGCLGDLGDHAGVAALGPHTQDVEGAMNASLAFAQLGDGLGALGWAKIATVRDPKRADAWVLYGQALMISQRLPQAVQAFDRALALNPGDTAVAELRAWAAREWALAGSEPEGPLE